MQTSSYISLHGKFNINGAFKRAFRLWDLFDECMTMDGTVRCLGRGVILRVFAVATVAFLFCENMIHGEEGKPSFGVVYDCAFSFRRHRSAREMEGTGPDGGKYSS